MEKGRRLPDRDDVKRIKRVDGACEGKKKSWGKQRKKD